MSARRSTRPAACRFCSHLGPFAVAEVHGSGEYVCPGCGRTLAPRMSVYPDDLLPPDVLIYGVGQALVAYSDGRHDLAVEILDGVGRRLDDLRQAAQRAEARHQPPPGSALDTWRRVHPLYVAAVDALRAEPNAGPQDQPR